MTEQHESWAAQAGSSAELKIEFGSMLGALADSETAHGERFHSALQRSLDALCGNLGIPGQAMVRAATSSSGGLKAHLNGRPVRFSNEVFRASWEYIFCDGLGDLPVGYTLKDWLSGLRPDGGAFDEALIPDFVAHLIIETIKQNPERLDAEGRMARSRPHAFEIVFHPQYLEAVRDPDSEEHQQARNALSLMREGFFSELGIRVPEMTFAVSAGLKPNAFALRWNGLEAGARLGLSEGTLLVNDTANRLRLLGIAGKTTLNPVNANECGIIQMEDREAAVAAGLSVWNPFEYVVLGCSYELRRRAALLLDTELVEYELARLSETSPDLAMATVKMVSMEQLTRVLRNLLDEEISIRDLRTILERLIVYDEIISDPAKLIIFDDRLARDGNPETITLDLPDRYTQFVRAGLKRYLGHKYTRGQNTLLVYLLAPEIESLLSLPLTEEKTERVLAAAHVELDALPATAQRPVILTFATIRLLLRRMIADEFPATAALSYDELTPDMNIQPISRISIDSSEDR
jgi:FHIPEP family